MAEHTVTCVDMYASAECSSSVNSLPSCHWSIVFLGGRVVAKMEFLRSFVQLRDQTIE